MTIEDDHYAAQTTDLTKTFGGFTAVDGLSLSVERGEIFGFLGPNGAGKTTTIRMLLSLLAPSSGTGSVLGFDIERQAAQIRRRIGYMSQRFSLYDDLSVAQNLEFFGGTYGLRGKHLEERKRYVLGMAGLHGREREPAQNLAGGWRQRLALGCAILHEPEMLFLDEPTAGVDPVSRRGFWDLLYELSDQGRTVFVTTHYMDEAERCHRLAFFQRGRLVALGTPDEIVVEHTPGQMLEITCSDPAGALALLRDMGGLDISLHGAQVHVLSEDAKALQRPIQERLEASGIEVTDLQAARPSLEDAFIASVHERETE